MAHSPEEKTEFEKLGRDLSRLEIDFEKSTPFAEWEYAEVVFPFANKDVTVRHTIEGKGEIGILPIRWEFSAAPATVPVVYTTSGYQFSNYVKLRSTVAGKVTVLLVLRRDS